MTTNDDDLKQEAHRLADSVEELATDGRKYWNEIGKLNSRNRRLIIGLAIGLTLDILLSVLLAVGYHRIDTNENMINQVATRVNFSQTVTRQQVLCPLYKILLGLQDPRAAAQFASGPAAYNQVFVQLRASYAILNCGGQ